MFLIDTTVRPSVILNYFEAVTMHPRARLLLCVFAIALGGAIVGIDIGIIATTIGQESFTNYMFPPGTANASSLLGAIVSMGSTGNVVGSLILGFSLEKLGRKNTVAFATFFTIIGSVMQAAANGVALMIVGRLVAGVAVGMLNGGLPVYISELAMPNERARLVGIFGLLIAIGFCVANWVGYACSYATGNIAWRLELAMQIPLAVVLLGFSFIVPESPRWRKSLTHYPAYTEGFVTDKFLSGREGPSRAVPGHPAQAVRYQ